MILNSAGSDAGDTDDKTSDKIAGASAPSTKSEWRSEMKRRLFVYASQIAGSRRVRDERISASVLNIVNSKSGLWLAFSSSLDEPSLSALHNSSALRFAFPRIHEGAKLLGNMSFYKWAGPMQSAVWVEHRLGIREPDVRDAHWTEVSEDAFKSGEVAGVLMPGLGFDRRLRRLGRGAGLYDRFLERREILKVGVGFGDQLADELPCEPHDVALDVVVTDRETIWRMGSVGVNAVDGSALRATKDSAIRAAEGMS